VHLLVSELYKRKKGTHRKFT